MRFICPKEALNSVCNSAVIKYSSHFDPMCLFLIGNKVNSLFIRGLICRKKKKKRKQNQAKQGQSLCYCGGILMHSLILCFFFLKYTDLKYRS